MAPSRIIREDFDGLNDLVRNLSKDHVLRIGIFNGKEHFQAGHHKNPKTGLRSKSKELSPMNNADIGALHEFGSFSKHVPPRSFLRMPIHQKGRQIVADTKVNPWDIVKKGAVPILNRLGLAVQKAIQEAFESHGFGTWTPNTAVTIAIKGSSAPLIDTGQLRRAITWKVVAR